MLEGGSVAPAGPVARPPQPKSVAATRGSPQSVRPPPEPLTTQASTDRHVLDSGSTSRAQTPQWRDSGARGFTSSPQPRSSSRLGTPASSSVMDSTRDATSPTKRTRTPSSRQGRRAASVAAKVPPRLPELIATPSSPAVGRDDGDERAAALSEFRRQRRQEREAMYRDAIGNALSTFTQPSRRRPAADGLGAGAPLLPVVPEGPPSATARAPRRRRRRKPATALKRGTALGQMGMDHEVRRRRCRDKRAPPPPPTAAVDQQQQHGQQRTTIAVCHPGRPLP